MASLTIGLVLVREHFVELLLAFIAPAVFASHRLIGFFKLLSANFVQSGFYGVAKTLGLVLADSTLRQSVRANDAGPAIVAIL